MIDLWYREHLEKYAITDIRKLLPKLEYNRRASMLHYGFSLLAGLFVFSVLFAAQMLVTRDRISGDLILASVFIFATLIVILTQYLKRNGPFVDMLLRRHIEVARYITRRRASDPLYHHFFVIALALFIPLATLFAMTLASWRGTAQVWVAPGSSEHQLNVEAIKEFISFCLAIVGAQLALFTFTFSYLLGKYSSQIVKSLITHRAVLGAWFASSTTLVLLWLYFAYGYPRSFEGMITPIFVYMTIACLAVTIWICVSGLDAERGVLYAGFRFGRTVRRRVKKSTNVFVGTPSKLWTVLRWLNLDWRDPERMKLYEPPTGGLPRVNRYLASLFNAANKAVEENQQELLSHSLTAILIVLQSYVQSRRTYYGSRDSVFSEVNNQMAALLKVASASANEFMPTLVVRCIGHIGVLSLQIPDQPTIAEAASPFMPAPKRHELSLLWAGLLEDSFRLTHRLLRTGAAYEAIDQLTAMAAVSHREQYFDTMATTFFSKIQAIHAIAVEHADAYHRQLGRRCIEQVMWVFALASRDTRDSSAMNRPFDECLDSLDMMVRGQFTLDALPHFDLTGCPSVLITRTSPDQVLLQDIFYAVLSRAVSEDRQRTMIVRDVGKILDFTAELTTAATSTKAIGTDAIGDFLYEVGYLIVRGLPSSLCCQTEKVTQDESDKFLRTLYVPPQDQVDSKLFSVWRQVFSLLFDNHIVGDWQWYMCSLLGIGFACIESRTSRVLRKQLVESVNHMRHHIVKAQKDDSRNVDHWWPYLQLLGAWLSGFVPEEIGLSKELAKEIAKLKSFDSCHHGCSPGNKFEVYGYPVVWHQDFGLPRPTNLEQQNYIQPSDRIRFVDWQAQLMSEKLLLAYYKEVQEIRRPIEDEFFENLRKRRAQQEAAEDPTEDKPG